MLGKLASKPDNLRGAAQLVLLKKNRILDRWETIVRTKLYTANLQEQPGLTNSLPVFLENLAQSLERSNSDQVCRENICRAHGKQRADLANYTLKQIITEYHVLRDVIIEQLEQEGPLNIIERRIILKAIDEGINSATAEFAIYRDMHHHSTLKVDQDSLSSAQIIERLQTAAGILSGIISGVGSLIIIGWIWDIEIFKTVYPGLAIMTPVTAFGFVLSGMSLWIFHGHIVRRKQKALGNVGGGLLILISGLSMIHHLLNFELGLLVGLALQTGSPANHLMSIPTTICFGLAGLAFLFLDRQRRYAITIAQIAALLMGSLAGILFSSYLFGVGSIFGMTSKSGMALHTSFTFIVLSAGILFCRPNMGWMAIITSPYSGGYWARRTFIPTLAVPILLAWVMFIGNRLGVFDLTLGTALLTLSTVLFFVVLNWVGSSKLNHIDAHRRHVLSETTEVIKERDQKEAAVKNLEDEIRFREAFVSALSHDLRGPITAAKMSAGLGLRHTGNSESYTRLFKRINENLNRVDGMIRDLLDASRIKAKQSLPVRVEKCELCDLLNSVIDELIFVHGERFVLKQPCSATGYWDRDGIRRVVENLCSNAVKYGAHDRPITVSVQDFGNSISLSVHNEGKPISIEDQKRLFEPFHRTKEAHSSHMQGWGIGLGLVRGICEAHGGTVQVKSDPQFGTTFLINLPKDARGSVENLSA